MPTRKSGYLEQGVELIGSASRPSNCSKKGSHPILLGQSPILKGSLSVQVPFFVFIFLLLSKKHKEYLLFCEGVKPLRGPERKR